MAVLNNYTISVKRHYFYLDKTSGDMLDKLVVTVCEGDIVQGRFLFIEISTELLLNVFTANDLRNYIGENIASMQEAFFKGIDDKKTALYFLSKYAGKLNSAERIYWLESVEIGDQGTGKDLLRVVLKRMEQRIKKDGGLMVFGEYGTWPEIGICLDSFKMRLVEGTIYRIGVKVDRQWFGKFGLRYVR